jgi:head-tail adaptor
MPHFIPARGATLGRHLNQYVTIQVHTQGQDGSSTATSNAWARIEELGTAEFVMGGSAAQSSQGKYRIIFRSGTTVAAPNTIVLGSDVYKVESVLSPPNAPVVAICTKG